MAHEPGRSEPFPAGGSDAPGEGVDKRQITRLAVAGLAMLAAAVFVVQNNERVETTFLVFNVTTRLWVGLLVALVLGALLGQAVAALIHRRRRAPDE